MMNESPTYPHGQPYAYPPPDNLHYSHPNYRPPHPNYRPQHPSYRPPHPSYRLSHQPHIPNVYQNIPSNDPRFVSMPVYSPPDIADDMPLDMSIKKKPDDLYRQPTPPNSNFSDHHSIQHRSDTGPAIIPPISGVPPPPKYTPRISVTPGISPRIPLTPGVSPKRLILERLSHSNNPMNVVKSDEVVGDAASAIGKPGKRHILLLGKESRFLKYVGCNEG